VEEATCVEGAGARGPGPGALQAGFLFRRGADGERDRETRNRLPHYCATLCTAETDVASVVLRGPMEGGGGGDRTRRGATRARSRPSASPLLILPSLLISQRAGNAPRMSRDR